MCKLLCSQLNFVGGGRLQMHIIVFENNIRKENWFPLCRRAEKSSSFNIVKSDLQKKKEGIITLCLN